MKYIGKLFLSLKEIFIMMILQYVILILCLLILGIDRSIIGASIALVLLEFIYIIWKLNDRHLSIDNFKGFIDFKTYFPYVLLGVGVSTVYNMIIFKLGLGFIATDFPIILNILGSGFIGPIFEELLFRYDFIRRLERFNSNKWLIVIIAGITFGIVHTNIITIIYASIVGFVNSYIYIKDKDIIKPIIVHISGNIFVNLLFGYNTSILLLGIALTIISFFTIKYKNKKM